MNFGSLSGKNPPHFSKLAGKKAEKAVKVVYFFGKSCTVRTGGGSTPLPPFPPFWGQFSEMSNLNNHLS